MSIYFLTVLEAESLRARYQQLPGGGPEELQLGFLNTRRRQPPSLGHVPYGSAVMVTVLTISNLSWGSIFPFVEGKQRMVKNPPGMQEHRFNLWVEKIPPEKEMATHSSILAWEILWT